MKHPDNLECGIRFNGTDILQLKPIEVIEVINSLPDNQQKFIKQLADSTVKDTEFPLENNYARSAGRPSLKELPYMKSQSDGYPYLSGHSPQCNGKVTYKSTIYVKTPDMCWCEWATKCSDNPIKIKR